MAGRKTILLTKLELEVMREVWDSHPVSLTARDVVDRVNRARSKPLAYNTVQTVLKILEDKRVVDQVQSEVDKYSSNFKGFERIKKICLVEEDFTTQNNMLTPSLKVKRRTVWQKYGPKIEALYADVSKAKGATAAA